MLKTNRVLLKLTGNQLGQMLLAKNVRFSRFLMGIGSGADVASSGEEVVFKVLKERSKPPFCIFDVGANRGQFLDLIFANVPVSDVSVHCFEPGHETFQLLAGSRAANAQVTLNNCGIGGAKGESLLHYDSVGSGLASLTRRRLDHYSIGFEKSEMVEIGTLDDYCSENAIDHIDLLKLDIEGHELDALSGAKRMLGSGAIDIVMFEFGGCNIDTRTFFQDFWYLFSRNKMRIFRTTPSKYLSPIDSYSEDLEEFATTNFIALREP